MESIDLEVDINARRSTVYQFLSQADRFRQWIGDADMIPGGDLAVRYPNGDIARGRFLEMIPDQRIVFTWGYENAANGLPPGSTTVTIELRETATGTKLTLRHEGIPTIASRDAHAEGWKHYTSRLSSLATAVGIAARLQSALDSYFAAWSEADDSRRLALLENCWQEEGTFCDSMGAVAGRAALSNYIGAALRYAPGAKLTPSGPPQQTQDYIRFGWKILSGETVFGAGTNFARLNAEGRFTSVVGFWNR